jgi:hypothetical protein
LMKRKEQLKTQNLELLTSGIRIPNLPTFTSSKLVIRLHHTCMDKNQGGNRFGQLFIQNVDGAFGWKTRNIGSKANP